MRRPTCSAAISQSLDRPSFISLQRYHDHLADALPTPTKLSPKHRIVSLAFTVRGAYKLGYVRIFQVARLSYLRSL